jgi:hypothetical protein
MVMIEVVMRVRMTQLVMMILLMKLNDGGRVRRRNDGLLLIVTIDTVTRESVDFEESLLMIVATSSTMVGMPTLAIHVSWSWWIR